jgi:oligopeptidase A
MTYADDRALRREVYEAFSTRASDQGPHAGQWDNSENMEADPGPAPRAGAAARLRATTPSCPWRRRWPAPPTRSWPFSTTWPSALRQPRPAANSRAARFAREHGHDDLQPWDLAYYSEKLRQHRFDITEEELKPYFPLRASSRHVRGRRAAVRRALRAPDGVDTWHPDVRRYASATGRRGTRASSTSTSTRGRTSAAAPGWTSPVAHGDGRPHPAARGLSWSATSRRRWRQPALLTHREVETLFHEFGHGLHHMLTRWTTRIRRHPRRALGRGGTAEPVHGELLLGARGPGPVRPPRRNRRAIPESCTNA